MITKAPVETCLSGVRLCDPGVIVLAIDDDRIRHEHEISFQICASSIPDAVRMLTEFIADLSKNGGIDDDCD